MQDTTLTTSHKLKEKKITKQTFSLKAAAQKLWENGMWVGVLGTINGLDQSGDLVAVTRKRPSHLKLLLKRAWLWCGPENHIIKAAARGFSVIDKSLRNKTSLIIADEQFRQTDKEPYRHCQPTHCCKSSRDEQLVAQDDGWLETFSFPRGGSGFRPWGTNRQNKK